MVTDYDAILNDDSINCVVELMGGVTDAKDVSGSRGIGAFICCRYFARPSNAPLADFPVHIPNVCCLDSGLCIKQQ